jgi:transposase
LADPFGVSGQLMLEALLKGEADANEIAELAKGKARRKIPELAASLEGHRMNDHHRRMIHYSLEHLGFIEWQLLVLDEEILLEIDKAGFRPVVELIKTVPSIQQDSAVSVLAEVDQTCISFPPPVISAPGPVCVQEIGGAR